FWIESGSRLSSIDDSEKTSNNGRSIRVCPQCRLLTATDSPICNECGYRFQESVVAQREHSFISEFFSRPTPLTYLILGINAAVYLLMFFSGGPAKPEILRAFGAKDNALIQQGEYWRFIMPIFIHIN